MRNLAFGFVIGLLLMYSLFHWFYPRPKECGHCTEALNRVAICKAAVTTALEDADQWKLAGVRVAKQERLKYLETENIRRSQAEVYTLQVELLKIRIEQLHAEIDAYKKLTKVLKEARLQDDSRRPPFVTDDAKEPES